MQKASIYAIRPKVQCREPALCNGRAIAFQDIYQREPLAVIDCLAFEEWELLRIADALKTLSVDYERKAIVCAAINGWLGPGSAKIGRSWHDVDQP